MDLTHLEEMSIPIGQIYLDPNNPRFWSEQTRRDVPDRKISDSDIQAEALANLESHGIEELANSILRNGFLPLDRIVVRPIEGRQDMYVVVEGNRRLAALKLLRAQIDQGVVDEQGISSECLTTLRNATDIIRVLVYKGEDASDVAWLLQGIRHISGIRPWQPAQRAKLVADQIEREGLGLKEAGQRFGLTAQAVGRLYRSYKALEQMRKDEEFSSEAKNEWFTLFEEAIRNPAVKTWLGWSEEEKRFTNLDHLHQFYAWIIPDTENSDRRRINDPRQIAKLGVLLEGQHQELLSQVDNHEVSVDAAADRIQQSQNRYDWREALEKAKQLIAGIPQSAIGDSPADVVASLDVLDEAIRKIRAMATAVQQSN